MRNRLPHLAFAAAALACGPDRALHEHSDSVSPNARLEIADMLRRDRAAERHPADGGGRAWIEEGPTAVEAGSWHRWRLVYETGPLGIAEGGMLFFQAPPFWGWSTPQTVSAGFEGFTLVDGPAPEVRLEPENYGQQLLGLRVGGRALAPGERVVFDYGAGPAGARADRYAESASRFSFAVDGDGDGVRALVADSPAIAVTAGPAARLALTFASTARPGDTVRLTLAALDAAGNAGARLEREIRLVAPTGLDLPAAVRLAAEDGWRRTLAVVARREGLFRVTADAGGGLTAESNPLRVESAGAPVLWADLHGHSALSDGSGSPSDYLAYARDVAALDVVALTDHDHWGLRPLADHPELWEEIRRRSEDFHEPRRFVTLLGFEWTSWIHGHRHVLFFGPGGEILDSVDPAHENPARLWDALRGRPALTFAHHSAGDPIATNWDFPPDPELEPVTEITSVHGSSEAADSPRPVGGAIAGNFVRDALDRGYRLGFVGSGDSHDGHPGLAHLAGPNGGLAALVGAERTRDSVLATLRARRAYATNGPRILLEARFDGAPMGSLLKPAAAGELRLRVAGTAEIERVDLVRSGRVAESVAGEGREIELARPLAALGSGEYLYVRVVQVDGGAAWSSPFFFE